MYKIHQPQIAAYAIHSPEHLADVYTFVLATIQQRIYHVPMIMEGIRKHGIESVYLWGFKRSAYGYMMEHKGSIYDTLMNAKDDHERLIYAATLPGLGIVKAGFMLQLMFGEVGCLDSHNIKRFGLNGEAFKASAFKNAKNHDIKDRMVADYITMCQKLGGSEGLWDSWCTHVAQVDRDFETPFQVSEIHVSAIVH